MKIGINLLHLHPGRNGGIETYVRNLVRTLFTIDPGDKYFLVTAPYNDSTLHFPQENVKRILFNDELSVFEKVQYLAGGMHIPDIIFHKIIGKYHLDIWFCPFLNLKPRPLNIPSIHTIPDIQHEYYPHFFQ